MNGGSRREYISDEAKNRLPEVREHIEGLHEEANSLFQALELIRSPSYRPMLNEVMKEESQIEKAGGSSGSETRLRLAKHVQEFLRVDDTETYIEIANLTVERLLFERSGQKGMSTAEQVAISNNLIGMPGTPTSFFR